MADVDLNQVHGGDYVLARNEISGRVRETPDGVLTLHGYCIRRSDGSPSNWVVVEHTPLPDWVDAPAILITCTFGGVTVAQRCDDGRFLSDKYLYRTVETLLEAIREHNWRVVGLWPEGKKP